MSTNKPNKNNVIKRIDNWIKIKKRIMDMQKNDVLIGVPQEKTERREEGKEPITNAELMFIHTKGSPSRNIPARPTLEPAVEENAERIGQMYREAIKVALQGGNPSHILEKIGLYASNKAKAKFGSDDLVPNAPSTIKQKGSDRPLIDTGQLRNSVTYVVRRK